MVEWKKLGEIAQLQKAKNKNHITENAYSITQNGLVPTKSFFKEKTNITSSDTKGYYIVEKDWFVYSPSRIDVGSINYLRDEGPVIVSPIDVVFSVNKNVCLPSYLLQYIMSHNGKRDILKNRFGVEGTGRRSLPFTAIQDMIIPIPSIEEQNRIVGILDTFTAAIENLKKQIEERRKQYEFYRDQLLDLERKEGVVWKRLEEVCDCNRGVRVIKNELSEIGIYPVFQNSLKSMGYYKESNYEANTTFVITAGAAGDIGFSRIPFWAADDCLCVKGNKDILDYFVFSFLGSKKHYLKSQVRKGAIPRLSRKVVENLEIPIPSLEEQQRIVDILDTFEASIQNLEAQLEQRQKQYEYYRNKLLTFE